MVEPSSSSNVLVLFGLNWQLFLAQLVNFGIVVYVLRRFVYKPLLAVMDERSAKINAGLEQAEAAKKAWADAEKHAQQVMRQAEEKATQLMDRTKQEAEEKRQTLLTESHQELERQIASTRAQLQIEREQLLADARKELGRLVMAASEKVTQGGIGEKERATLVERSVKELATQL